MQCLYCKNDIVLPGELIRHLPRYGVSTEKFKCNKCGKVLVVKIETSLVTKILGLEKGERK